MFLSTIRSIALAIMVLMPFSANAQTSTAPAAASETQLLKPAELDQLVAPIALYNSSNRAFLGVMAQEVQQVMPAAVVRGLDGYLSVYYDKLGLKVESYSHSIRTGANIPTAVQDSIDCETQRGDQPS